MKKRGQNSIACTPVFKPDKALRASGVDNAEGKQKIVIELYDKFFKTAFPLMAQRLGIVYTPMEVVDFILHSVNHVLETEFDGGFNSKGNDILDPFTGTGTFIVRLLQSGLIEPKNLRHEYEHEIHANEIVLLAYYIAAVNIEQTFAEVIACSRGKKARGVRKETIDERLETSGMLFEKNDSLFSHSSLNTDSSYSPFPGILETQQRVPVTHGFEKGICQECRGEQATPYPKAQSYGCTSKIRRYYWREIAFETLERMFTIHPEMKNAVDIHTEENEDELKKIEKEVIESIKQQHEILPKYQYSDKLSQDELIKHNKIEKIQIDAIHIKGDGEKKVRILDDGIEKTAEQFAIDYFKKQNFDVLELESRPFHALFAVYLWPIIQDPCDPCCRISMFGNRTDYERDGSKVMISTVLPSDFGTEGYFTRRQVEIISYISDLTDFVDTFDTLLFGSYALRQYLWAHDDEDIIRAKRIATLLDAETIKT
ncbi:MAG: hypothetical protein ACRC2T_06730, partial [Thermoguttaceae bacterium]